MGGRSTASAVPKGAPKCISEQQKCRVEEAPESAHSLGLRCAGAPQRGGTASNSSSEKKSPGAFGRADRSPDCLDDKLLPAARGEARGRWAARGISGLAPQAREVDTVGRGAVGEESPQSLGHGDRPLPHGHGRGYLVNKMGCGLRHVATVAGRAHPSALARESNDEPMAAARAESAGESAAENATGEIPAQLIFDVGRGRPPPVPIPDGTRCHEQK